MLARRRMLGSTLFGGMMATWLAEAPASAAERRRVPASAATAASPPQQIPERQVMEVVEALRDVRRAIDVPNSFAEILPIRQKQIDYLKATNKFPEYIDVGLDVWFAVHDWHVKHLQQPAIARDSNGRYTITVMGTQLIMRPDLVPTFISAPYDSR